MVGRAFLRSQMPMLFLAIGFALGVPTSPKTTAASAIRQLQPDGTESLQSVPPDASGTCPQGTCPIGTCPQGTCPHGPKPAGTSSHGPKPAGTKPGGTKPGGTHPYEKRQNAIINSCVPDKSAPDCPMPPVCGGCEELDSTCFGGLPESEMSAEAIAHGGCCGCTGEAGDGRPAACLDWAACFDNVCQWTCEVKNPKCAANRYDCLTCDSHGELEEDDDGNFNRIPCKLLPGITEPV